MTALGDVQLMGGMGDIMMYVECLIFSWRAN